MHKFIATFTLLALTGCASVTGSRFQSIAVETKFNDIALEGADCTLTNAAGKWTVLTPASVKVQKSISDMVVECKAADDLSGQIAAPSKANHANWGNLLAGGPVGLIVDFQTGAGYDYPSIITVLLNKTLDAAVLQPVAKQPPEDPIVAQPHPVQAAQTVQITDLPPVQAPVDQPKPADTSQPDARQRSESPPADAAPPLHPKKASSYWE